MPSLIQFDGCHACTLKKEWNYLRTPKMPVTYPVNIADQRILIIGEAPGDSEDIKGQQFVGITGQYLRDRIPPEWKRSVYWGNCVRCQPPKNRTPTDQEMECCSTYMEEDLLKIRPHAILGAGNIPLRYFWPDFNKGISKARGIPIPIEFEDKSTSWFYPIFHPSYVVRGEKREKDGSIKNPIEPVFRNDILNFFKLVTTKFQTPPVVYTPQLKSFIYPKSYQEAWNLFCQLDDPYAIDFETFKKKPYWRDAKPLTASFSDGKITFAVPILWPGDLNPWGLQFLKDIIASGKVWICQSGAMEYLWITYLTGVRCREFHDTEVIARLLHDRTGLGALEHTSRIYLGFNCKSLYPDLDKNRMNEYPLEKVLPYNALDSWTTFMVFKIMMKLLCDRPGPFVENYIRTIDTIRSTVEMEIQGLDVDISQSESMQKELLVQQQDLQKKTHQLKEVQSYERTESTIFSVSAPQNVARVLTGYCIVPETKILKSDLTWCRADNAQVGFELIGFDELTPSKWKPRKYRRSKILEKSVFSLPCVEVETDRGSITCSDEHKFLVERNTCHLFTDACNLKQGDLLLFFSKPWQVGEDYESGYLSGVYDGEGCLSGTIQFSQNPGTVLDYVKNLLDKKKFTYRKENRVNDNCETIVITGGIPEWLRFLGSIRPLRLLKKGNTCWEGKTISVKSGSMYASVKKITPVGRKEVVALKTSTSTLITEGYFSHNCGIQLPKNEDTTFYSTAEDELEPLRGKHPLVDLTLDYREVAKQLSTYVVPILSGQLFGVDGKLHPAYKTCHVKTWRLSSELPNIQNWPKRKNREIRRQIVAPPGHLIVSCDYGGLEARGICMACNDENLKKSLINPQGFLHDIDIHWYWLHRILDAYPDYINHLADVSGETEEKKIIKVGRTIIKTDFVFPTFYGSKPEAGAARTGVPVKIMEKIWGEFWDLYPTAKKWVDGQFEFYNKYGYVESLAKRCRNEVLGGNEPANSPIQELGAYIVLEAQNALSSRALEEDMYLHPRFNIHDDLSFILQDDTDSCERYINTITDEMVKPRFSFINVPLLVEVSAGYNWADQTEVCKKEGKTWDEYQRNKS